MDSWQDESRDDPQEADLEEHDDMVVLPCPQCGQDVYEDAEQCPHCGRWIVSGTAMRTPRHWLWALGLMVLVVLLAIALAV